MSRGGLTPSTLLDRLEAEGITQADLARRMGVSRQNVSAMFSRDDMKLSTAQRIVESCGLDASLVIQPSKDKPSE